MSEYTATIDKNIMNGDWVIRVRYEGVGVGVGERRRFQSFVLVPIQSHGFSDICNEIESAIELHRKEKP